MPTDDDLTALLAVVVVLVPTALEVVRGVSVLEAGILFLGFSVPFAFGGALSGFMIRSRTAPTTLALGAAAMVLGMVALAIVGPDGPLGSLILTLALTGLGNGIVYSAATSYALIDIETDDAAEASAALSAARVLGLAVAVAISTSMMTTIHIGDPSDAWGLGWRCSSAPASPERMVAGAPGARHLDGATVASPPCCSRPTPTRGACSAW